MNKVFNNTTAVGKSGKVAVWSALSVIVVAVLTTILQNPSLFSWKSGILVVIANVALVLIRNLSDKSVPNI